MFHVAHSDRLSMLGVFQLVNHCSALSDLQDLESFSRVQPAEIESLNQWVREHNLVLRTTAAAHQGPCFYSPGSSPGGQGSAQHQPQHA